MTRTPVSSRISSGRRSTVALKLMGGIAAFALLAGACGGDDSDRAEGANPPKTGQAPSPAAAEQKIPGQSTSGQLVCAPGSEDCTVLDLEGARPGEAEEPATPNPGQIITPGGEEPGGEEPGGEDPDGVTRKEDDTDREFQGYADGTQTVWISVPAEWTDVRNAGFDSDGDGVPDYGAGLTASTDIDAAAENWGVGAVTFVASNRENITLTTGDYAAVLEANAYPDNCTDEGTEDFVDHGYTGLVQTWTCGKSNTQYTVVAAGADDGSHGALVTVALPPDDVEVLDTILGSFQLQAPLAS